MHYKSMIGNKHGVFYVRWFDYISIYLHANVIYTGVMGVLTMNILAIFLGYFGWTTWKWYEEWRKDNDDLSGLFG